MKANNLRELRMNVNVNNRSSWKSSIRREEYESITTAVRNMMLREGSVLRVIGIGTRIYRVRSNCASAADAALMIVTQGKWVYKKGEDGTNRVEFDIASDIVQGLWDRS